MIEFEGQTAAVTGDMNSHPCQLPYPNLSRAFDEDPIEAVETGAQLFGEWVDGEVLVIGTHYAGPSAGRVRRKGVGIWLEV